MFDTLYLLEDHSQSQNRLAGALVATVAMLSLVGVAVLGAERMQINRVEGPELSTHLLFLPSMPLMPEAKVETPPDAPKSTGGGQPPSKQAAATPPSRSDASDSEPDPNSRLAPKPTQIGNRNPFQAPSNSMFPNNTGTGPSHLPPGPATRRVKPEGPKAPVNVRRSQLTCMSCPDPSSTAIRQVASKKLRSGRNITRLCVNEKGRVENVSTRKSAGDPRVDELVRKTVRGWEMRPFRVDGRARRACTTATFSIEVR